MALETSLYINGLVPTNPTASDQLATADDHLRLLKSTLKNTFPNIAGEVTLSHTAINALPGDLTAAQAALEASKAAKTTTVSAGAGLTGGGDLSANRTLALATTGVTAGTYGSSSAIPVLAINDKGQVTSASTTPLSLPVGAGSVSASGGTFTAQTGPNGVCLLDVTGAVRALYGNFGEGTFSISIGGTQVASDTVSTNEYEDRRSGDHGRAVYKYTGTANSTFTVTVNYSGPGEFKGAKYTYIGV